MRCPATRRCRPTGRANRTPPPAAPLHWLCVGGGIVALGHDALVDGSFHFDNEGPRHEVLLRDFELASRPVTYGEFQAFIADGGYRRPELWLSMGWDWVRAGQRQAPLYWQDDGASVFTLAWTRAHRGRCHAAAPELLRSRCLCTLGRCAFADRIGMGACGAPFQAAA